MRQYVDLISSLLFERATKNYGQALMAGSCSTGRTNLSRQIAARLIDSPVGMTIEYTETTNEEVLSDYTVEELEPQKKGLRIKRRFIRNEKMDGEGIYGGSSRSVSSTRRNVDVTNYTRGKEHGLPGSSGMMGEAVPPNLPVWRALSDFLIDRMEDAGDLEATTQIVDKADLKTMVSQGMRFRHTVNGVSVTYTDKGTYYVQHYPGGQNSMSRSLQYMTKEIAALIIYETQIEENFRKEIEKLNPPTYSNYKILVEELMEEGYKYNPNFDQDDIDYFDDVRKEVIEIANSLVL